LASFGAGLQLDASGELLSPNSLILLPKRLNSTVQLEGQNAITDTTSESNRRPTAIWTSPKLGASLATNQLVTEPAATRSPRAIQATIGWADPVDDAIAAASFVLFISYSGSDVSCQHNGDEPEAAQNGRGGVSIIVTSFWFQIARMIRGDPVMSEPGDLRPIMLKRSCCEASRCKRFHRASLAGIPLHLSQHLTAPAIAGADSGAFVSAFSKTLISWSKCSPSWFLASRDANGDGHEPRDGNRDCDPKYRVFEHPCEIPRFGHLRASICNYRHLYARRQLWANGTIAASRVSRALVCGPGAAHGPPEFLLVKARSGSDSCFD
jgi:hypothetical protein